MTDNQECIQLLNTAIIKSKEKKIDSSYEQRLSKTCNDPAVAALTVAINFLAEKQKISNLMHLKRVGRIHRDYGQK